MKRLFVCIVYATAMVISCSAASYTIAERTSSISTALYRVAERSSLVSLANTLFAAALEGDERRVKWLLKECHPNRCSCPVLGGVLARFIECSTEPKATIAPIFQIFLAAGAFVNARNITGGTALHVLAASRLPNKIVFPCIYALFDCGIETSHTEFIGDGRKTALQRACYFKELAQQQRCPELVHLYGLRIAFMNACRTDKALTKTVADFYSCSEKRVRQASCELQQWRSEDPTKFEQIANYLQES